MFTPIKSFLFLLSCLLILSLVSYFGGDTSFSITSNYSIRFFNIKQFIESEKNIVQKEDSVKAIIQQTSFIEAQSNADTSVLKIDTLKIKNFLKPLQVDKNFISKIEYPNNDKSVLKNFFDALKNAANKSIHILYYGDSQIEEDRFSGFFREKWQMHFGGNGVGYLPFMPVAQWITPKIIYSDNWQKYACFATFGNTSELYGPAGQSFFFDSNRGKAKIVIKCNSNAVPTNCLFNRLKIFYGYASEPIIFHYLNGNEKLVSDTLSSKSPLAVKELPVSSTEEITLYFEGFESPYFYGLSLESYGNGVYVDNIALRGSSGTFFHWIKPEILREFFKIQNVQLIILQFGGNALPMIDSEEKAQQYVRFMDAQIKMLKKIQPNISILFVGPSDMSVNINGVMQTHPFLESVNNGLKQVAMNNRCAYFDMYSAMGGRNSMVIWVEENMAAKDYIHFTPSSARKMAALIYYSLMKDYIDYIENSAQP